MHVCSFLHIWWRQPPHHDLSVSVRLFLVQGLLWKLVVVLQLMLLLVLLFGARVTVEIGDGAPARGLARAAVWCKGYCGNW